jgi:hypothetical protein
MTIVISESTIISILITIEQHVLDTNAEKTTVLSCYRCLINTGVEKMHNI